MLTQDEIKQIASAVKDAQQDDDGGFHIDAKKHYDTHTRLDRLLDVFEYCESRVWKFILSLALFFGFIAAVVWVAITGGPK